MIAQEDRLTYKSSMGDFGGTKLFDYNYEEIAALRNALGKYEEIGLTPQEIIDLIRENAELKKTANP